MAEKAKKATAHKAAIRKEAPKAAADTQGHAAIRKAPAKKAAPRAADTEGHAVQRKGGINRK